MCETRKDRIKRPRCCGGGDEIGGPVQREKSEEQRSLQSRAEQNRAMGGKQTDAEGRQGMGQWQGRRTGKRRENA